MKRKASSSNYMRKRPYKRRTYNRLAILPSGGFTVSRRAPTQLKFFDDNTTTGPQTLSSTPANYSIATGTTATGHTGPGIIGGSDDNMRESREICYKSLLVRGQLTGINMTSNSTDEVRIIIVLDRANNQGSTIPAFSTVFDTSVFPQVDAPNNITYKKRFKVIWDRWYRVAKDIGNPLSNHFIKEYIPLKDYKAEYKDATGTLGAINSGSLLIYAVARSSPGTTGDGPTLQLRTRLRWKDC
jgi:hypothetical protein